MLILGKTPVKSYKMSAETTVRGATAREQADHSHSQDSRFPKASKKRTLSASQRICSSLFTVKLK